MRISNYKFPIKGRIGLVYRVNEPQMKIVMPAIHTKYMMRKQTPVVLVMTALRGSND